MREWELIPPQDGDGEGLGSSCDLKADVHLTAGHQLPLLRKGKGGGS